MIERFWQAIVRTNARAVFYGVSLVCMGTALWWTGHLLGAEVDLRIPSPNANGPAARAIENGKVPSMAVAGKPAPPLSGNPFSSWYLSERIALQEADLRLRDRASVASPADLRPREIAVAVKPPPPATSPGALPPPAKPPRTVSLLYRGMMTRTDGTTLALIENGTTGETEYYSEGAPLDRFKVGAISREALVLQVDGAILKALEVGVPTEITEP